MLGSLPGAASLAAARYYAHPRNAFWRLIGETIDTPLAELSYEARLEALLAAGVGVWDVIATATRPGSLDAAIRDPRANDLARLASSLSRLAAIGFNGGTALRLGGPLVAGLAVARVALPSSSPAYTMPFARKADAWKALRAHLA